MAHLRFLAFALALGAVACSDTPTTPTPTTPPTFTDNFTGSLNPNGATTHSFSTASSGTVSAILNSLAPDSALSVGFGLGTWNGNLCQVVLVNDRATQGSVLIGATSAAGSLCVRIYDVGNVVDPTTYEVQVTHP